MFEDNEILEGCKNNDRKAQELLYNKYASLLLGVLFRYSRNRVEAEDILQEAFVRIFRHIDQFRGDSTLFTWMKKVAVNSALRTLESQVNFNSNLPLDENFDMIEKKDTWADVSADDILHILHIMPAGFRTIFNMYAIEGYKHKEIAEQLGISENTSRSQFARARKFIQKCLYKNKDIADLA